jgi:hypothetical protein
MNIFGDAAEYRLPPSPPPYFSADPVDISLKDDVTVILLFSVFFMGRYLKLEKHKEYIVPSLNQGHFNLQGLGQIFWQKRIVLGQNKNRY